MARYQSASEFGDSLSRALVNEGETARGQNIENKLKEFDSVGAEAIPPGPDSSHERYKKLPQFRLGRNQLTVITIFCIILVSVGTVLFILSRRNEPNGAEPPPVESPAPGPTRSFTYSLSVQRFRDGKPYQDPFQSTGQETYESGDKFRLNVTSSDPGYLYVFNEGPPEPDGTSFTIIYPTNATNNGSATLGADQWVRTTWNRFTGQPGTENFWFVWSTAPINQLESAKTEAFNRTNGTLSNESLDSVKRFLMTAQNEAKMRYTTDKNNQLVTVRGTGDVLVRMVQFKHR
jgi:hypothetical protein